MKKRFAADRRSFLRHSLGAGMLPLIGRAGRSLGAPAAVRPEGARFLIVMQGSGGASIIDSFLALSSTEVTAAGGNADTLNCFQPSQLVQVPGTNMKAVSYNGTISELGNFNVKVSQESFVKSHASDLMVVTLQGTSITHPTAQKRSVTGNEAWHGRTLQECCAVAYGQHLPIPNLLLGSGGYVEPGADDSLPTFARGLTVSDSRSWSRSLSSSFALSEAPSAELLNLARNTRDQRLDLNSNFFKTFKDADVLKEWVNYRSAVRQQYEAANLAANLNVDPQNPAAADLLQIFPSYQTDDLEAQAVLACLAITQDISCTVTMGPSFSVVTGGSVATIKNPPIAFDFSHAHHRGTQALMWHRILDVTDRMMTYLKGKEYGSGRSFYDHTAVYFATDFGRSKLRAAGADAFASAHDLNNGVAILSPLANGNTVLGGVDAKTALTYGFDPSTGNPVPGRSTQEKELFCGILQILGIDTSPVPGSTDMRAMRKA